MGKKKLIQFDQILQITLYEEKLLFYCQNFILKYWPINRIYFQDFNAKSSQSFT